MNEPTPESRDDPTKACRDKRRYQSYAIATMYAYEQSEEFKAEIEPYHCPHCLFWHTGNTPRWLLLDRENGVFVNEG